jgi:hypothetical protein
MITMKRGDGLADRQATVIKTGSQGIRQEKSKLTAD